MLFINCRKIALNYVSTSSLYMSIILRLKELPAIILDNNGQCIFVHHILKQLANIAMMGELSAINTSVNIY